MVYSLPLLQNFMRWIYQLTILFQFIVLHLTMSVFRTTLNFMSLKVWRQYSNLRSFRYTKLLNICPKLSGSNDHGFFCSLFRHTLSTSTSAQKFIFAHWKINLCFKNPFGDQFCCCFYWLSLYFSLFRYYLRTRTFFNYLIISISLQQVYQTLSLSPLFTP